MTVPLFALLLPEGLIVYFLQVSISYQTLIGGGGVGAGGDFCSHQMFKARMEKAEGK